MKIRKIMTWEQGAADTLGALNQATTKFVSAHKTKKYADEETKIETQKALTAATVEVKTFIDRLVTRHRLTELELSHTKEKCNVAMDKLCMVQKVLHGEVEEVN